MFISCVLMAGNAQAAIKFKNKPFPSPYNHLTITHQRVNLKQGAKHSPAQHNSAHTQVARAYHRIGTNKGYKALAGTHGRSSTRVSFASRTKAGPGKKA